MAIKIVSLILGFITAVASYPWLDQYLLAPIALIGAIAAGIVVYLVVIKLLIDLTT